MGEAKLKMGRLAKMQAKIGGCIYCGGWEAGTTIDHMPPKMMFDKKHRPAGLEFLACRECNQGGSLSELVASFIGRSYDGTQNGADEAELEKVLRSIDKNCPGFVEELEPTIRQRRKARRLFNYREDAPEVFNANGPILNHHMMRFGAKLALALHFERTGCIAPIDAWISVLWYTNEAMYFNQLPQEAINLCGDPMTLEQGRFSVADQFEYRSNHFGQGDASMHYARFRLSFALVLAVDCRGEHAKKGPPEILLRPGFLRHI